MSLSNNYPSTNPSLSLDFANTKTLDPRITFTRASTATYYDASTTAKAEENLFLQSQDFTTTWVNTGTTDTANTDVAPDGTTTADTITDTAVTSVHDVAQVITTVANATYVFSCFLKNGTRQFALLAASLGTNSWASAKFDLSAGTAGSTGSAGGGSFSSISSSITSVGNSWYRCTITFTINSAAAATFRIGLATDGTTFTAGERGGQSYLGDGSTILLWGAQLEQRSAVTAYTATTTQPITNYIPVLLTAQNNVPRFEHNPVTRESLGLEIEEQRTNLLLRSEDFANAAWGKDQSSITSNTIISPDGTLTGDKLIENTASTVAHNTTQNTTISNATAYTYSIFAKAGERTLFDFLAYRGTDYVGASINLTTGVISAPQTGGIVNASGSTSIVSVGNGWFRISINVTSNSTTGQLQIRLSNGSSTSYTGDGYSGIFIWGAQLEAGAFATSYIPTVASQVTRSQDLAVMTGTNFSSWYNYSAGTLYAESQTPQASSSFAAVAGIFAPSGAFVIQLGRNGANSRGFGQGVSIDQGSNTFPVNTFVKQALAGTVNDFSLSTNASAVATDTATSPMPSNAESFAIGNANTGSVLYNGLFRKIAYYPRRLTNAELQGLTTV